MTHSETQTGPEQQDARYREAAEELLHQLRWCVHYLYTIRKPGIARVIASNCDTIEERLAEAGGTARGRDAS